VADDELLARAERALTEIKVNRGLSEEHEAVLAALRIRLKGSDGATLEEMLAAAADQEATLSLEERLAQVEQPPTRTLDDLFNEGTD
jgi:Arc/MetJ family transcription regulator